MLQEALEVFEKMLTRNDRFVIDAYSLKDGTYRLIEMRDHDEWRIKKTLDIFYDKKTKELVGQDDEDYFFIKQLDYYSKLLEMNKPIDPKKVIHTNNYLSMAVKKESIVSQKLTQDIMKNYYQILKNPISKYAKKAKAKQLYQSTEKQLGQVDSELLEKIEKYVMSHHIFEGINLDKKNYIKIFFVFESAEKTLAYYKKESERYLLPNLYNSNDYNFNDHGVILGLPNNNMGMNSKKPFLESKTRKIKVPYLLDQQSALLQSQFFDYLWGKVSQGQYNFYVDTDEGNEDIKAYTDSQEPDELMSGYYIRCRKEKNEVEIIHANNVSAYSKRLEKPFILKNYIGILEKQIDKSNLNYNVFIDDLWPILYLIDNIFFERKLKFNFYSRIEDIQINNPVLKRCLLESRDVLAAWFYEGKTHKLQSTINKFSLDLIKNTLRDNDIYKAQNQLNLRWSLLTYFNERGIGEKMVDVRNNLRKHINLSVDEEWDFENDQEFAYAIGQVVYYFTSLNKSSNKSHAFINTYLNAKNVEIMKKKIEVAYKKYNYLIQFNNSKRISQLLTHIMTYQPKVLDTEYIMAGFTAPSLIFEKKKEDNQDE